MIPTRLLEAALQRPCPKHCAEVGSFRQLPIDIAATDRTRGAAFSKPCPAQQGTHQLVALSIKQQRLIQTMMATQGRAEALNDANNAESKAEGGAAFSTFLGSSNAYTP